MKEHLLFFFIVINCLISSAYGINGDSTQISLLTVYPRPNQVYTVYGHTAIRFYIPSENIDYVFNYGMFDSSRPNFIYHFMRGETDYMLDVADFKYFQFAYGAENSTVAEQILNIPSVDKERMWEMLMENIRPENRVYRYNYFFDNCTTRPRDIIEKYCGGQLVYPQQEIPTTLRTLVHGCTANFPWMTFGIDLVIGNGADSAIGLRQEMFLPVKLMDAEDKAYVIADSMKQVPLVLSSHLILEADKTAEGAGTSWFSPLRTGIILLVLVIGIAIIGFIKKRKFRFFFGLVFLSATLAGCIVAFMSLFSTHPCTWPNWNLLWLHPLYIIPFIGCLFKKTYRLIQWFHVTNFVLLSVFSILWQLVPQEMNIAFIPLILSLGFSSLFQLVLRKN